MATVYLAEDVTHHRKVAVKVLRDIPEKARAENSSPSNWMCLYRVGEEVRDA